ncbi:hypothetical protein NQ318_011714, partial [Aromia moschata]
MIATPSRTDPLEGPKGLLFGENVEHMFFILNASYQARSCEGYEEEPVKYALGVSFPNYFTLIKYTPWAAAIIKFSNTIATFTWIFTDLFITLISLALTARFKQIVKRLENNKVMHEKFWREIRQDYHKLYHLSKTVEKHFAILVFVSYVHNIYFLCIQLYNSIRERKGVIESIYFFYSFGFLVLRLLVVSLYAAWLNDEAKKPLEYLYSVPTEHYCTEISRLIEQICTSPIAITGSGFFLVTKNFVLQVSLNKVFPQTSDSFDKSAIFYAKKLPLIFHIYADLLGILI